MGQLSASLTFNRLKIEIRTCFWNQKKKTKILTYGAKKVSSLQIKSKNLTVETGTKFTAALFYVTDSNSHNLLTGECVIELYLICLHRTTSDKRDKCATLQEVSVCGERKKK